MTSRLHLFGIDIDPLRLEDAVDTILGWLATGDGAFRYVVTPNVDHIVTLQDDAAFRTAYRDAALVLADGQPLVWAARLLGRPLPERVAGSDLVPTVLERANAHRDVGVFLLGAAPHVAARAADLIGERWPNLRLAGRLSPDFGFETDPGRNDEICAMIERCKPDLLIVALGAPRQECWIWRHRHRLRARVALCTGAAIDFLVGERARAPRRMQSLGLEWLHRLCSEPARLGPRYARDAVVFPRLLWREWRHREAPRVRS